MKKEQVITQLTECGLVAVVRAADAEEAIKISDACLKGGCSAIELTFTVPHADKVIEALAEKYPNGEMLLGAGTVLDSETARLAILAGANFIVSPSFNLETAKLCNRYSIAYMPGVQTFTEIVTAMDYGCDIVKIFPASAVGIGFIKAVMGPLPQARCIPVGGVSIDNIDKWFDDGAYAVALGSGLTHPTKGTCDYDEIKAHAEAVVAKVKSCKRK